MLAPPPAPPQPLTGDSLALQEFSDQTVGMNIPKSFIPGVEKGFLEVCDAGQGRPSRARQLVVTSGACRSADGPQGDRSEDGAAGWGGPQRGLL